MKPGWIALAAALLAAPALAQPSAADLPAGCAPEGTGFLCEWDFDTTPQGSSGVGANVFSSEVPVRGRMLATVTVRMEGRDMGWSLAVVRSLESGDGPGQHSWSAHNAQPDAASFHSATAIFVLEDPPFARASHELYLTTGYVEADEFAFTRATYAPGSYHIVYAAEALPAGEVPLRPAATGEDPQVADLARDARQEEYDVLAAWLDDARVGDKLFDAHMRVADLASVELPRLPDGSAGYVIWSLPLRVEDERYEMRWFAGPDDEGGVRLSCNFRRQDGQALPIVGLPSCAFDAANGTMHAVVPEGFIGSPGAGVRIEPEGASTSTSSGLADTTLEDEASATRYAFALGGPAVWSELNPRLDPTAVASAWYEDPLASENLPNTLQVAGAAIAVVTTLVGAIVVWRSRRQTRELLARVDTLVDRTDANAREALLALGELEREFTRLYHAGRINETQYQVATQRIVTAASRLSLRKELGFDEATSSP